MAVRISHASCDENKKAKGGAAGDQTGKEVKISSWYAGGWEFLARAKDPVMAARIAHEAEAGANNPNIGYDQISRNTLMTQAKAVAYDLSKIEVSCECDCSSFVSVCVRAALGRDYYTGNAPTTRTLKRALEKTGAFEILTHDMYLTGDACLLAGDILCKAGSHTVIVLDSGGGVSNEEKKPATYAVQLPVLKKGSTGAVVRALQILLIGYGYSCGKAGVDGDFGSGTENALECFQEDNDLEVDAKCGPKTWATLLGAGR